MENIVFLELVKRGNVPNRYLFYYKTRNDREIDFLIKKGIDMVELVQACYDVSNKDVEQREIKALVEASQELNVSNLTILTWDEKREVKKGGKNIKLIPIWEWLLNIKTP